VISIDKFFGRNYHPREYNCAHFVVDVLEELIQAPIRDQFKEMLTGPADRQAKRYLFNGLVRLKKPVDYSIAVFNSYRTAPHVGIYLRGRILHLSARGVEFQPLEVVSQNYRAYRFYECRK
jgi:hypothetical protein